MIVNNKKIKPDRKLGWTYQLKEHVNVPSLVLVLNQETEIRVFEADLTQIISVYKIAFEESCCRLKMARLIASKLTSTVREFYSAE